MTKSEKKTINALLHKLVALRDKKQCLRCGKTENLALSHIFPRGKYRKLEFDENNLKLLCFYCHICWWHKNPLEANEWIKTVIPAERLKRLKLRANTVIKDRIDYKLLKVYLEAKIKEYEVKV